MQPTRAKLMAMATTTVTTLTDTDHKLETYINGGWNLAADDDAPRPETDPMTSPQARRAAAQLSEEP